MKSYDVIVVGGGIIGCTLACELRKAKQKVALIEKHVLGAEASTAAAGMLAPHAGPRLRTPFFNLLRDSLALFPQFVAELEEASGMETEFRNAGLFHLAFDEEGERDLEEKLQWQGQSGVEAEWVSASELRKQEPFMGSEVRRGLSFPEDCQVDNVLLVKAVGEWARRLGAEILLGHPATKIWIEENRVRGVFLGREKLEAPCVVNAAGSWADFDHGLPFAIPIRPARGQILVLQHHRPLFNHIIYTKRVYAVTRHDGRLIVGSTVESVGYDKSVTVRGLHKLLRGVLEINPELGLLGYRECWAGLRPRSKDNLPILGKCPVEGLLLAAGHFRNGILLAPLTARILANVVLGEHVSHDLSPFEIMRFFADRKQGAYSSHPAE